MTLPEHDPLDERYRWCIYCEADCWPEPENQRHFADCPSITGLFPVTDDMVGERCGYGDGTCDHVFQAGDVYMDAEVIHHGPDRVVTAACIGCALRESIEDPR